MAYQRRHLAIAVRYCRSRRAVLPECPAAWRTALAGAAQGDRGRLQRWAERIPAKALRGWVQDVVRGSGVSRRQHM